MSAQTVRLAVVGILATVLAAAAPAEAQQWKIYLLGRLEPIVADFYVEDAPWILFHDDESKYVFAIGCNRVDFVERNGVTLPKPACPVDKLPTTMPQVYITLMDLEAKRLDDSIVKLRGQTRAYTEAIVGTVAGSQRDIAPDLAERVRAVETARASEAVAFLRSQINDTLVEIRLIDQRVDKLLDAAKSFPAAEKQRFFFAPR